MKRLVWILFLVCCASTDASARTWYILPDGTGDARTIQAGIDSAQVGDIVELAPGLYTEGWHFSGEYNCLVSMKGGIVLRGDPMNPSSVTIDAQQQGICLLCYGLGDEPTTTIEGITFTGAMLDYDGCREAVRIMYSSPLFRYCRVVDNDCASAFTTGTVYAAYSSPTFEDCVMAGNCLALSVRSSYGDPYALTMTRCEVMDSSHTGVMLRSDGYAVFEDCAFTGNMWGLYVRAVDVDLIRCTITDNATNYEGAAMKVTDGSHINISECVIAGNTAQEMAGAIFTYDFYGDGAEIWITDSVIAENESPEYADAYISENSVLYANGCSLDHDYEESFGGPGTIVIENITATQRNTWSEIKAIFR